MNYLLEIDSVQLSFGERNILNNIYVKSETGKITGILGRNGSGKSCLLKLIFGEISTNEKSVRINGNALIFNYRNPEDMRMLPQFNFLPRRMKVGKVFEIFNVDYVEFCNFFAEFQEYFNLRINKLSGGDVRIIETYLILKSKTKFCLLDEPFTHLSPKNISTFIEIIHQEKTDKGIILTDHLYNHIMQLSDELYVINNSASYKISDLDHLKQYGYLI
jgi:ABC-type multidrug transport system ATPase subunit